MKKYTKALSLLMAFALAFSLTACKGGNGGKGGNNLGVRPTDYDPKTMEAEILLPRVNVTGDTVKVLTHAAMSEDPKDTTNILLDEYYNTKIENVVVPHTDLSQKLISMVMAGDSPDLTNVFSLEAIFQGLIVPWNGVIDPYTEPLWKNAVNDLKATEWNGKVYRLLMYSPKHNYVFFNKKLFDEAGVEYPFEAYKRGEWDWNKMIEYGKELTQDTNGDGTVDIYGLLNAEAMDLLHTTGKSMYSWVDGKVVQNFGSPEFERFANFFQDIYAKSKIASPGGDFKAMFTQGKVAMSIGHLWHIGSYKDMFLKGTAGMLPDPKDPATKKPITMIEHEGLQLAKGAKNPGGAAAVVSVIRFGKYDPEDTFNIEETYAGFKVDYKFSDEQFNIFLDHYRTYDSCAYNGGPDQFLFEVWDPLREGRTWSSVREGLLPKIENYIDDLMTSLEELDDEETATTTETAK